VPAAASCLEGGGPAVRLKGGPVRLVCVVVFWKGLAVSERKRGSKEDRDRGWTRSRISALGFTLSEREMMISARRS
jgi:hypothetical protein